MGRVVSAPAIVSAPASRTLALGLVLAASAASTVAPPALARAQDEARETAARVHREGRYADDVVVLVPESDDASAAGGSGGEGAGRGPRGETSIDGDRVVEESPGPAPELPWLRDLIEWLGRAIQALSGPLGWLFLALAGALLVMVIAFFVASLRFGAGRIDARARDGDGDEDAVDPLLVGSGASADSLAAAGRYREAIHALFLDALARVGGEEGRQRGRTARELVRAVRDARAGRAELVSLLDLTEIVWFGGRDATEAQYLEARALWSAIPASDPGDAAAEMAA